jgi:hypothetical protein
MPTARRRPAVHPRLLAGPHQPDLRRLPLNDSGNYQIYPGQQLDPELIEQVNVNLGTTDVDSPTAAATGSTVNYRTRLPNEDLGIQMSASVGEFNFFRVFGAVDTGEFTSFGTRAFLAASKSVNDNPYNNYGKIDKTQVNARIYQPLGEGDDFISISGHYDENRNNFFGSVPLRLDTTQGTGTTPNAPRVVGSLSTNRFPLNNDEREYDHQPVPAADQRGVRDGRPGQRQRLRRAGQREHLRHRVRPALQPRRTPATSAALRCST